jgi:hypothetical protein
MNTGNTSTNRFTHIPDDDYTTILSRAESEIASIPVLVEASSWDGIYMQSIVFASSDVEDKDDEALAARVHTSGRVKSESAVTISRKSGAYTFVNFNFFDGDD